LLDRAEADGVGRVRVHVLTDGRDVAARSALTWVEPLEARLAEARERGLDWRVGSGGGRMRITMDRYEADWAMVERGYRCHVLGEGPRHASAAEAIQAAYDADPEVDDQYLPAFVVTVDGEPCGRMADGDTVLLFNFRGDRALEISRALGDPDFAAFDVASRPSLFFAGMMEYDGDLHIPTHYLVPPPAIDSVVGEHLAAAGKRTFATSETQKFGHVTFFFNGNRSGRIDEELETYLEIPSDLATPDTRPWMKAAEVTDAVIDALQTGRYDHVRLNLANGDMVGHTGNLEAARIAVEAVDLCVGRLVRAARRANAVLLVTADHGNADEMVQHKGGKVLRDAEGRPLPKTSHTLNPVPFIVYDPAGEVQLADVPDAGIANIGATLLALCGVTPPADYLPSLVKP
ncbi:MAG: alkaline phosphatase family protein, partial [Myxococcales bacterium]|nr:alkaline phosphatase family protein [Myxococcales bacterium]